MEDEIKKAGVVPEKIENFFAKEEEMLKDNLQKNTDIYEILYNDIVALYNVTNDAPRVMNPGMALNTAKSTSMENIVSLLSQRTQTVKGLVDLKRLKVDVTKKIESMSTGGDTEALLSKLLEMMRTSNGGTGATQQAGAKIAIDDMDDVLDSRIEELENEGDDE